MIETALTRKLGLKHPVVAAPLGRGSTPAFLRAVASAGGLGFVAMMGVPEADVFQRVSTFRDATAGIFGINLTLIVDQHRRLEASLDAGARIISLWQADPEPYVKATKDAGATLFWTVGTPAEAARAADLGVDFLVAQGREAGGHLVGHAPIMSLLPAIVDAAHGVPVLAAGGIADGRGLAAALCLGAAGIWMGTRFLASVEAGNHGGHKQRIIDAGFDDLIETRIFDGGWPDAPHRVLRNSTVDAWLEAGCPPPGSRPGEGECIGSFSDGTPLLRYDVASPWAGMAGEWEATALYAGTSAQLIDRIPPVRKLLETIVEDARASLNRAAAFEISQDGVGAGLTD